PARTLDVGCGTGGTTAALSDRFGPALGCELNPYAVRQAAARIPGRVFRGRAESLPIRSGSIDLVTGLDVLYHREVDESRALSEWRRVLAPGGTLYVSDSALPCLEGPHDRAVHARERYTARSLADRVRRAGFDVVKVTYWNFFLFPIAAAFRLGRRVGGQNPRSDLTGLPPVFVNRFLAFLLLAESSWLRRFRFPIGTSVALVARKPDRSEEWAG
ncbi:MAG: class I SAM-dependent methyltransferase, partial [Nitrospirae bacterium]|nr:class I SAM-dependent methyltransferase [Nitrospirota bacterium]